MPTRLLHVRLSATVVATHLAWPGPAAEPTTLKPWPNQHAHTTDHTLEGGELETWAGKSLWRQAAKITRGTPEDAQLASGQHYHTHTAHLDQNYAFPDDRQQLGADSPLL